MYRFCVVLRCEGDIDALTQTIESLAGARGFAEYGEIIAIFPRKRYTVSPEVIEMFDNVFFEAQTIETNAKVDDLLADYQYAFYLGEGDTVDPYCFAYIDNFFRINLEKCASVRLPVTGDTGPETGCKRGTAIWIKSDQSASPEGVLDRVCVYAPVKKKKFLITSGTRTDYLISCIIPIYKVEKYLREAIDSVVNQTIGFEENVQLILVNDGSPDGCGEICREYLERYPENVVYIEQENRGVSAARNAGLDAACGEFVAFLDGDDWYDACFIKKTTQALFEKPLSTAAFGRICDYVGRPISPYTKSEYSHSRIVDTAKESLFLGHMCAGIFRASTLRCRNSRNEFHFLTRNLSDTKIVYLSDIGYNDRFPDDPLDRIAAYETVDNVHTSLFAQNLVMDCIRRIPVGLKQKNEAALTADTKNKIKTIVNKLDDSVIEQEANPIWLQAQLWTYKYGIAHVTKDNTVTIGKKSFGEANDHNMLVTQIYEKTSVLHIEAMLRVNCIQDFRLDIDTTFVYNVTYISDHPNRYSLGLLGDEIVSDVYLEIDIYLPGDAKEDISFYYRNKLGLSHLLNLRYSGASSLAYNNRFFIGDTFLVSRTNMDEALHIETFSKQHLEGFVRPNICEYILPGKEKTHKPDYSFQRMSNDILRLFPMFSQRRIWLFMDRHRESENNAEALFRYTAQNDDGIEKWYVIPKESCKKNFEGLRTVVFASHEFMLLLVFAEKFISSFLLLEGITLRFGVTEKEQAEYEGNINFKKLVRQFFRGDIIHLQHGVVSGDISVYLDKNHEHYAMLCSLCERERDYIQTLDYAIPSQTIKMTGLPKYDILERIKSKQQKINNFVLFAPSFDRRSKEKDHYIPDYKLSEHYRFINGILSSGRLNAELIQRGYTLLFKPHYLLINNLFDFELSDCAQVVTEEIGKYELYENCDLMITDYSGIAFEWAYLEKPLLYAHICENTKFEETYYSYENDGFGEICTTVDELIDTIILYIDGGCAMPEEYKMRVNDFFTYRDENNCERIYHEILNIPDTRKNVFAR